MALIQYSSSMSFEWSSSVGGCKLELFSKWMECTEGYIGTSEFTVYLVSCPIVSLGWFWMFAVQIALLCLLWVRLRAGTALHQTTVGTCFAARMRCQLIGVLTRSSCLQPSRVWAVRPNKCRVCAKVLSVNVSSNLCIIFCCTIFSFSHFMYNRIQNALFSK